MSYLKWSRILISLVLLLPLKLNAALLAHIETNFGTITAELDYVNSPRTVANFVRLAEGFAWTIDPDDGIAKRRRFYDGSSFHRVAKNFVLQGGCPIGDGSGGPGWTFPDETDNGINHQVYSLSMANAGPNSNGSQFFIISRTINVANASSLNGKHTVFGRVNLPASRLIVDAIENTPVDVGPSDELSRPISPVTINSVTIEATDAAALSFNPSTQGLPSIDLPIDRDTQLRETADGQLEILTPQAVGSEMRVFRSTDLETWSLQSLRYIPADGTAENKFSFPRPEDDQGFYRVTLTDYPANANSPSILSDKRITVVAFSPINSSQLSFYDFFLNSDGTGTWQARVSANQVIAQGTVDGSSHLVTPYGGTLIISSSNLPYSSGYRFSYGLSPNDDPQGSWTGEYQLTYLGVRSWPARLDFEIVTLPQP